LELIIYLMGMHSSCFSLLSNCIAFRGWKMFSTNLSPPSCSHIGWTLAFTHTTVALRRKAIQMSFSGDHLKWMSWQGDFLKMKNLSSYNFHWWRQPISCARIIIVWSCHSITVYNHFIIVVHKNDACIDYWVLA
jgi:hypothetical protein